MPNDVPRIDAETALRHVALAEADAAVPPGEAAAATPRSLSRVGVIGAGTMGSGIAMSIANAGLSVRLIEASATALRRGMDRIANLYRTSAERGRITLEQSVARIELIEASTEFARLADCDLVIEAVFEEMAVKLDVFGRLGTIARPDAILASNTSYLDLDEIARASGRPTDVVGLHYFSPANVMKLMEVVRGDATAPDVLRTAFEFAQRCGKVPVVSGVCNGFIGNRMLRAYNREAGLLLLEGATPDQVDGALTGFGMAMGPFAVADLSGIDIGYRARRALPKNSYEPRAFLVHDQLAEYGHLGQKTGSGFYIYENGKSPAQVNPEVDRSIAAARGDSGISPRAIDEAEIIERCVLALANEGDVILREGIAARSGDIDVVYVNGYGFPRSKGGPMFYAGEYDQPVLRDRLERLRRGPFGKWWHSAPPLPPSI